MPPMAHSAHGSQRMGYVVTLVMLALALAFPVGLMIFDPTLMFERGWEQYVGTAIYAWAVLTLTRELFRLWKDEAAFEETPKLLALIKSTQSGNSSSEGNPAFEQIDGEENRVLHRRVRQLACHLEESHAPGVTQLMEVNREASGLDQEQMAGRFTLTRYILYLLPVIGFIGTVEGISKALMNISRVLPMVKDLDGFLTNLTSVTSALQIAFDSTLLALFLSAALMLVQTLVFRRSEDLLARVDRWVVERLLPKVGSRDPLAAGLAEVLGPHLDRLREDLAASLAPAAALLEAQARSIQDRLSRPVERFSESVEQLPTALSLFQQGAEAIGRIGSDLEVLGAAGDSLRRGSASLARIETALTHPAPADPRLDEIRQGLDRACSAIENLSGSWATAYERSSRSTQEQLAKTLNSLKDALELINVSMEQGHSLYRNIVKKLFDERAASNSESVRAA
jgi:biopolymer transport protein ExbB/TolQ